MVRAPRLPLDRHSTNSGRGVGQMPIRNAGPMVAGTTWLGFEPTSKSHLARCLARMYEYQEDRGAAPLPNLDEFLAVLARPHWTWTPEASTLFRRIAGIIHDSRRSSYVRAVVREMMERRRAALWRARRT